MKFVDFVEEFDLETTDKIVKIADSACKLEDRDELKESAIALQKARALFKTRISEFKKTLYNNGVIVYDKSN